MSLNNYVPWWEGPAFNYRWKRGNRVSLNKEPNIHGVFVDRIEQDLDELSNLIKEKIYQRRCYETPVEEGCLEAQKHIQSMKDFIAGFKFAVGMWNK